MLCVCVCVCVVNFAKSGKAGSAATDKEAMTRAAKEYKATRKSDSKGGRSQVRNCACWI